MLESVATWITRGMINLGSIPEEDAEIYVYGWSLVINELTNLVVMFTIGLIFGHVLGTLLFLLGFIIVRIFAGGYHANTFAGCFLISLLLYLVSLLYIQNISPQWTLWSIYLLLALSAIITYIWSPIDHPNKPQNKSKKARNRKISCGIITTEILFTLFLLNFFTPFASYLLWFTLGIFMTSVTVLYEIIRPKRKEASIDEIH